MGWVSPNSVFEIGDSVTFEGIYGKYTAVILELSGKSAIVRWESPKGAKTSSGTMKISLTCLTKVGRETSRGDSGCKAGTFQRNESTHKTHDDKRNARQERQRPSTETKDRSLASVKTATPDLRLVEPACMSNKSLAATCLENSIEYVISKGHFESDAFFSIRPAGGTVNVLVNTAHPAYEYFGQFIDCIINNNSDDAKVETESVVKAIRIMLLSWARYENELPTGRLKQNAEDARKDWGRIARGMSFE